MAGKRARCNGKAKASKQPEPAPAPSGGGLPAQLLAAVAAAGPLQDGQQYEVKVKDVIDLSGDGASAAL